MRIVICAKEVPDPDAVNNYALEGRLVIGDDGKTLTQTSIPRLMNAYDEQAIEAALRFRDDGTECTITVVCAGAESEDLLKHAAAMGADEIVAIPLDATTVDYHVIGDILAAYVKSSGGADLLLCGRQASDDDQGVVPAVLAERLDMPLVSIARDVALTDGGVRVTRVTPDGDEVVEASRPAIVTISNELGTPALPDDAEADEGAEEAADGRRGREPRACRRRACAARHVDQAVRADDPGLVRDDRGRRRRRARRQADREAA